MTTPPDQHDALSSPETDTISHSVTPPSGQSLDASRVRPVLLIFEQNKLHDWFMIVTQETRVGRESGVEIRALDDTVSRVHSRIVFENIDRPGEEPVCVLHDEKSRNGTMLNGKKIEKPVCLRNGDRIFVGATCLAFFLRTELEISSDKKLRDMATTDAVTGLLNRGYMAIQYQKEIERAQRYNRPLSLLMIEIDSFHEIVDRDGQHNGDMILDQFSKLLTQKIRVHDSAARYNSSEFAVILPETGSEGALVIAERLRRSAGDHVYSTKSGQRALTISIGVAQSSLREGEGVEALIAKATNALAEAKNRGRNVVHYSEV